MLFGLLNLNEHVFFKIMSSLNIVPFSNRHYALRII